MENKKESMERFIATEFLKRILGDEFDEDKISHGDHIQKEPDIKYLDMGIELGAVLSATNEQIDIFENEFFSTLNDKVRGNIHPNLVVALVMQDERDVVDYSAKPEFEEYKLLPKYLDGIFVHFYETPQPSQVCLNQTSGMRVPSFPNPRRSEIDSFVKELVEFVNRIEPKDFMGKGTGANNFPVVQQQSLKLHYPVCNGEVVRPAPDPIDAFFSERILDKFRSNKYSDLIENKILLLHNYSPFFGNIFSSNIHFYSHYRDNIFNRINDLIADHDSFNIYTGIYFADYSLSPDSQNLQLIDFSEYERCKTTDVPKDEGHIRCGGLHITYKQQTGTMDY